MVEKTSAFTVYTATVAPSGHEGEVQRAASNSDPACVRLFVVVHFAISFLLNASESVERF